MTTNEIMKKVTEEMKKNGATKEQISNMEICIQYLGNEKFREWLNEFVFNETYKKEHNPPEVTTGESRP